MLKKHMFPLSKGGAVHKHKGKGSQMAAMPDRNQISGLANSPMASMNDYAKATPMPQSTEPNMDDASGGGFGM